MSISHSILKLSATLFYVAGTRRVSNGFTYIAHFFFSQQWVLEKQDILKERQVDLKILAEDEYMKILIFYANCRFIVNVIYTVNLIYTVLSIHCGNI